MPPKLQKNSVSTENDPGDGSLQLIEYTGMDCGFRSAKQAPEFSKQVSLRTPTGARITATVLLFRLTKRQHTKSYRHQAIFFTSLTIGCFNTENVIICCINKSPSPYYHDILTDFEILLTCLQLYDIR